MKNQQCTSSISFIFNICKNIFEKIQVESGAFLRQKKKYWTNKANIRVAVVLPTYSLCLSSILAAPKRLLPRSWFLQICLYYVRAMRLTKQSLMFALQGNWFISCAINTIKITDAKRDNDKKRTFHALQHKK